MQSILIDEGAAAVGKTFEALQLEGMGIQLSALRRKGVRETKLLPGMRLQSGDVLVLAGNVHAMLERPSYAPEEMQQPMGFYLKDLEPKSINVSARVGSFWSCITPASCQQAELMPRLAAESGETSQPYSYEIVLPVISLAELLGSEQSSHRKPREEP